MRWLGPSLLLVLLTMLTTLAVADSMRCDRYVVSTGDAQSRVLDVCGEPQRYWQDGFIEQIVRRDDRYYVNPTLPKPRSGYEIAERRLIPVYKWEYNFGPGTLLKTLIFHGDTLMYVVDGHRQ